MNVGFIGLGNMGYPMAANLVKAGHVLSIWNRSGGKGDDLVAQGARRAMRPADTVGADGIALTMVADDAALEAVVCGPDGIGDKLGPGGIHVSMSTVSANTADRLAALHRAKGAAYVAAPVFGRPDAAAARRLFVLCAGPAEACRTAQPLLEAMGQKVFLLGDDPKAANIVKLGGNFMLMAAIETMAEALTLAEKYGVPREKMLEVLTQTLFPAPVFVNYGRQIAHHAYEPAGFKLSLGLKDANLVLAAAGRAQMPMPLASLVQGRFLSAMAKGRKDLDWGAVALGAAEDAGLDPLAQRRPA